MPNAKIILNVKNNDLFKHFIYTDSKLFSYYAANDAIRFRAISQSNVNIVTSPVYRKRRTCEMMHT